MLWHVNRHKVHDVSKDCSTLTFSTNGLLDPEDEDSEVLQNTRNIVLLHDKVWNPRSLGSSAIVPWAPQFFQTVHSNYRCSITNIAIKRQPPKTKSIQRKVIQLLLCILLGVSPASDSCMPTFRNPLSVPSSRDGCEVWEVSGGRGIYIPGLRLAGAGRTNGERGSGSGWFRVGKKVWRGRYKSRVSGCGRVIVCSMAVPPFFECV